MHVSLEVVHQRRHPRRRHYRTEEERQRAEEERREKAVRRFASLTAQLLSPLCGLFSAPALSEHWYVKRNEVGLVAESKPDPPLIVAAGSITLALALLANIQITFRLIDTHSARTSRSRLFTLSTITLLVLHIIVNVVALTIFAVQHAHPDGYVLSTAFWLTTASSAVAFLVVALLLLDGFLTSWYTRGGTGVSGKQRSLIIAFDIFVALVLIGSVVNRYLTDLNFLDAVYFVIQSVITTGFGDVTPTSTGSQAFSIAFNTLGILAFALVVAFTRATALEAMQEEYKSQERLILNRLRNRTKGPGLLSHVLAFVTCGIFHTRAQQEDEQDQDDGDQDPATSSGGGDEDEKDSGSEHRFEEAITELRHERNREIRSEAAVSFTLFLVFWVVGAAVFMKLESWSFWHAFYFSFVSFSSIGYGDYAPKTQGGRAFFCVWALLGAGILTVFFSVLADAYSQRFKETFQHPWFRRILLRLKGSPSAEKDLDRCVSDTLPSPPHSSSSSVAAHPAELDDGRSTASKEGKVGLELLDLLEDVKKHLDRLIINDGDAKSKHLDSVVRRVMDQENFSRQSREEVENDGDFKQFIYLRSLQAKLAKLERLAQQTVGSSADTTAGEPSGSGEEQAQKGSDIQEASGREAGGSGTTRDPKGQAKERTEDNQGGAHYGIGRA